MNTSNPLSRRTAQVLLTAFMDLSPSENQPPARGSDRGEARFEAALWLSSSCPSQAALALEETGPSSPAGMEGRHRTGASLGERLRSNQFSRVLFEASEHRQASRGRVVWPWPAGQAFPAIKPSSRSS